MGAIKIGILRISNYDANYTYSIDTLLMGGGDAGVTTYADFTLNNLTLSEVVDLPNFGDSASVAGSDSYSVEVTATDTANNATVQSLTLTLVDTAANAFYDVKNARLVPSSWPSSLIREPFDSGTTSPRAPPRAAPRSRRCSRRSSARRWTPRR